MKQKRSTNRCIIPHMYFSRLEFQETLFVFSVNFERIDKENIGLNIKFTCLKKNLYDAHTTQDYLI